MLFDFSGILGLLILATFPCLLLIMGQSIRWTVQGQRLLAHTNHHNIEGLQAFWGGLALLLLSLFLSSIILSLHTMNNLLSGILLLSATASFLLDIAISVYWTRHIQQNML